MMIKMHKKLVVCDLDNTLYDWITYFVTSFYSMVNEVVELTGCNREELLDDFQFIHRKYGDSEHPFSLLETNTIRRLFVGKSDKQIAEELDTALLAFNRSRKKTLCLYPGVYEGLNDIQRAGVKLVAYTESNLFSAVDRLNRLGIESFFEKVFCRRRSPSRHPDSRVAFDWFGRYSLEKFVELADYQRKPNAAVLIDICNQQGAELADVAYVGDSMARDILMAKEAGIFSIWAKYGAAYTASDYQRLVRITHWTAADVEREVKSAERVKRIKADAVLEENFAEIVGVLCEVEGR